MNIEMKERVKLLRKILGMTQKEFANSLGLKQSFISEIEQGNSRLSNQTLKLLKHLWGINPDFVRGTSSRLFVDHEKGLRFFQEKIRKEKEKVWTRYELLSLVELCKYVWSKPLSSKTSLETRGEFKKAVLDSIKHLMHTCKEKDKNRLNNELAVLGKNTEEALSVAEKITATFRLMENLASVLCYLLEICEMSEEDEKVLSSFLLPWSYYVGLSYNAIKQNLIPLSSIYFSPIEELLKFEKKSDFEKLELSFEKDKVYFEFCCDKFNILLKDKLQMTLDISDAFSFLILITKAKEVDSFAVLGFSISKDKLAKSIKLNFTQKGTTISVMFSYDEFDNLVELAAKVKDAKVKENGDLWLYLQKTHFDRYGFV